MKAHNWHAAHSALKDVGAAALNRRECLDQTLSYVARRTGLSTRTVLRAERGEGINTSTAAALMAWLARSSQSTTNEGA